MFLRDSRREASRWYAVWPISIWEFCFFNSSCNFCTSPSRRTHSSFVEWITAVTASYCFCALRRSFSRTSSSLFRRRIRWLISALRIFSCSSIASKRCTFPLVVARLFKISMISFLPSSTACVHSSTFETMFSRASVSFERLARISFSLLCSSSLSSASFSFSCVLRSRSSPKAVRRFW